MGRLWKPGEHCSDCNGQNHRAAPIAWRSAVRVVEIAERDVWAAVTAAYGERPGIAGSVMFAKVFLRPD